MSNNRRGKRGSGKTKRNQCSYPQQNQAIASNQLQYSAYLSWLFSLAVNTFEWQGLPPGCDARYLEMSLCAYGTATVAHKPDESIWWSLRAGGGSEPNAYGNPTRWQAMGDNGRVFFDVTPENGFLVWERKSRTMMYPKLDMLARKLAKYERVESVNLSHQFVPWMVETTEEQAYTVENILAQALSGQVAVFGVGGAFDGIKDGINATSTKTEWIGDKLQKGALGVWGEAYRIMGIPHLQFEKTERMITDEAQTTLVPTRISLDDRLESRMELVRWLHDVGFADADVRVSPRIAEGFERMGGGAINVD